MKKLLFIALFSFGLFSVSNAQFLTYSLTNSGVDTWDYKMANAGIPGSTAELNILPGQVRTGFVGPGYAFPLEFKCQNSNGCGTYQFVPTTTTGVFVPINNCGTPTALKYRVELAIPFVVWELELKFG